MKERNAHVRIFDADEKKGLRPLTASDLVETFKEVGVTTGDTLLVHTSLSKFGYIIGGAEAIYDAIMTLIGTQGTIVVPSQTVEISDPSTWQYPPVPEEWFEVIREHLPAFDPTHSYSKSMGQFSQFIGQMHDSCRSKHPMYSFTAIGKYAKSITDAQNFDFPFGTPSPLSKLYDLQAKVLMVGTDFETNTCLHLAENQIGREIITEKSKIKVEGVPTWIQFKTVELDRYDDYLELQEHFFDKAGVTPVSVNDGLVTCFSLAQCVDFAREYYLQREKRID